MSSCDLELGLMMLPIAAIGLAIGIAFIGIALMNLMVYVVDLATHLHERVDWSIAGITALAAHLTEQVSKKMRAARRRPS